MNYKCHCIEDRDCSDILTQTAEFICVACGEQHSFTAPVSSPHSHIGVFNRKCDKCQSEMYFAIYTELKAVSVNPNGDEGKE